MTFSPATRDIETPLAIGEFVLPVPSDTHVFELNVHPSASVSATVNVPTSKLLNVTELENVLSAPPSSSRVKLERPLPVVVKAKSWELSGWASLTIVIELGAATAPAESERS